MIFIAATYYLPHKIYLSFYAETRSTKNNNCHLCKKVISTDFSEICVYNFFLIQEVVKVCNRFPIIGGQICRFFASFLLMKLWVSVQLKGLFKQIFCLFESRIRHMRKIQRVSHQPIIHIYIDSAYQ